MILFLLVTMTFFSRPLLAREELVIIQAISSSKKTFVVNKGQTEGVNLDSEAIFSTEDSSIVCRAIEVNRDQSLWKVVNEEGLAPFKKDQFVTYNPSTRNIWSEIPDVKIFVDEQTRARAIVAKKKDGSAGEFNFFHLRGYFSYTSFESASEIDSESIPNRNGFQVSLMYYRRYLKNLDIGVGLRWDKEEAVDDTIDITIESARFFVLGELVYHFDKFDGTNNNLFAGLGIGYGTSETTISGTTTSGTASILPYARFGYLYDTGGSYDYTFETSAESISTTESFEDGDEQTTSLINVKVAIGLRF